MTTNGTAPAGALVRQQSFSGSLVQEQAETAAIAVAAQAKASIEAKWIVAQRSPRNFDQVRHDLMRECARPGFARVARYNKPIGAGITGPSIRFVEAALQYLGNVESSASTIYDDDAKRVVDVKVIDYERNVTHSKEITITKVVERSYPKGEVLGKRTNSYGKDVYLVKATDDELLNKEAALVSKAIRTCGLRVIPGWMVEECMDKVVEVQLAADAKDPDLARRQLLDYFGQLGVTPQDLAEWLGHDVGKIVPAELTELRGIYAALRDGETSWVSVMDNRHGNRDTEPEAAPPAKGTATVKSKLHAKLGRKTAEELKAEHMSNTTEATRAATQAVAVAAAEPDEEPSQSPDPGPPPPDMSGTIKRPSRSKAARDLRASELIELGVPPDSSNCAIHYVKNGDERNRDKAVDQWAAKAKTQQQEPDPETTAQEPPPSPLEIFNGARDGYREKAAAAQTEPVVDDDEEEGDSAMDLPDWMKAPTPPPDDQ